MKRTHALTVVLAACITAVAVPTARADIEPAETYAEIQAQIDEQLAETSGGIQVDDRTVSYKDGDVLMVWPEPGTSAAAAPADDVSDAVDSVPTVDPLASNTRGCPRWGDWYCFYEYRNFGGRMLQFRDCKNAGLRQDFRDYAFNQSTSSWVNTATRVINVFNYSSLLWTEGKYTQAKYVGAANDNKAVYFDAYC